MSISKRQWYQMKDILFNHRDPAKDCLRTSNHYGGSVARPTQPIGERGVCRCTSEDYISDKEKKNREIDPTYCC